MKLCLNYNGNNHEIVGYISALQKTAIASRECPSFLQYYALPSTMDN